ncbi:MAG: hypothetical protein A2X61_00785 [Ignavibacteria bacterium GWB2_35_12]|nr:MAG: hypothetical protein A2X61_00785 [Ignavibacteria bacterium GWB2_35_12]OGU87537.1 MAG: hypothetical protein A2220_15545 [Ignavibacteria bacterium RIFOXYA2_FULL_35_10]OGV21728.1 MAG: hypothetical protein A2475_04010 [Ignavibacteria bacterium RIFOXYC2_FULL_35_21]
MYSPKIKPELIPKLYLIAKEHKKPMTKLVSNIIEEYINNGIHNQNYQPSDSSPSSSQSHKGRNGD